MTGPENHGGSFDAHQKRATESWKSKEKGMKGRERMGWGGWGGGVQRQKIQEDKNSFSKSREQRVLSEKVHASKTRLKGNRRLSAGQSGCPKPESETSGGGGTCQGRGPINPGPPPVGGQMYLECPAAPLGPV